MISLETIPFLFVPETGACRGVEIIQEYIGCISAGYFSKFYSPVPPSAVPISIIGNKCTFITAVSIPLVTNTAITVEYDVSINDVIFVCQQFTITNTVSPTIP